MKDGGPASSIVLRVGARTDVGHRRKANEDSLFVGDPLYVVADGMGGHAAGDLASQAVIEQLSVLAGRHDVTPLLLSTTLASAHGAVRLIADANERGAGSTVTGVVLVDHDDSAQWLVFNIGDSRVYRFRDGELVQLTVDHSLVQELVDDGTLRRDEMATYAGRNIITRAVGADDSDADCWLYPVVAGERLVLCSDGLTGEVDDGGIARILSRGDDAQETADALVQEALDGGGRDNVTVLVVDVVAGGVDDAVAEAQLLARAYGDNNNDDIDDDTIQTIPRTDDNS